MRERDIYLCSKKYIKITPFVYDVSTVISTVCCMMTLYMISSCSFLLLLLFNKRKRKNTQKLKHTHS